MKKHFFFLVLASLLSSAILSQNVDVFNSKDMIFYGLDFSASRFVGGSGLTSPIEMQDKYMPALNDLMIMERSRYDVATSYHKKNVEYTFNLADNQNRAFNVYDRYVDHVMQSLTNDEIQTVVNNYNDSIHHGLGLLYVVDEINHFTGVMTIQIVFFNIDTKEILLVEKARENMMGFSIRNYYAGAIRQIIKDSKLLYERRSR